MASTLTTIWTALVLLLGLAESRHVWNRYRINPPAPRWLLALLPVAAAVMLTMVWIRVVHSPFEDWNGARMAPVVAWTMGLPLYYGSGTGPATDFIYGPVGAILRLPATLATTPTAAIIIASFINMMMMLLPVYFFVRSCRSRALGCALALLVYIGFSLTTQSLVYSAYNVHSDAPAVGFALLACGSLLRASHSAHSMRWLAACAVFATLSIFSKQNLVMILLVFPLYAWLRLGWRSAAALLGFEAISMMLAAGISIYAFGLGPLQYSTIEAAIRPRRWPRYDWPLNLFVASGYLIEDVTAPVACLSVAILIWSAMRIRRTFRSTIRQPWFLPLCVGFAMIPSSLVGYARVGGEFNSFTLVSYFVVASLAALIADHRIRASAISRVLAGTAAFLCIVLAMLSVNPWDMFLQWRTDITFLHKNPQQTAFEFSLKHPQEAYFPWEPLATLMSDKKYYLFEYGIVGLRASGEPTGPWRVLPYVPAQMKYLVYPKKPQSDDLRRMFPEYTHRIYDESMGDWTIWTRADE